MPSPSARRRRASAASGPPVPDQRWSPRRAVLATVVAYLAGLAALVLVARPTLRMDYFFDEMWRADLVRSDDLMARYHLPGAPIPLGWLYVLRGSSALLPDGARGLRLQSLAASAPLVVAAWALVQGILAGSLGRGRAALVAASAAALVVALPAVTLAQYLNDYLFQAACTAVVVWLWWRATTHPTRAVETALLAGVVLLPLATMSGLVVLPVIGVDLLRRHRRGAPSTLPLAATVGALVAGAALAATVALTVYQPQASDELAAFWADGSLRSSGWGALGFSVQRLWDAYLPARSPLAPGGLRHQPVAQLAVLACTATGLVVLGRRWVQYPVTLVVAVVLTAGASLVVDWPLAPERVNLPYLWMLFLATAVGLVWTVAAVVRSPALAAVAVLPLVLVLAPSTPGGGPQPFARGLTGDLDVIAHSPVPSNIVLSYHFMSQYYAHDRLVNATTPERSFVVAGDDASDDRLTSDPDSVALSLGWSPGTAVWCVLPFELGPEGTERACRLALPGLVRHEVRLSRAVVVAWLPESAGALAAPGV